MRPLSHCQFREPDTPLLLGRKISRENDTMTFKGSVEVGQRHGLFPAEAVHESLELGLIGMVANISGVNQSSLQCAPAFLGHAGQFLAVDPVIQQASQTPYQVNMKIIGLQAINH